jgi:adenine phosphoribosyltransferase
MSRDDDRVRAVRDLVRDIPDFPKPGILFKDITPVLADPAAFGQVTDAFVALSRIHGATRVVGIESRGFIFGAPVARELGVPFAPVRKPGKLPYETARVDYTLEYGTDALEIHTDGVAPGDRVVVVDDLLATGGTAQAACQLIEQQGATIAGVLVVIELTFLEGARRLEPHPVASLIKY